MCARSLGCDEIGVWRFNLTIPVSFSWRCVQESVLRLIIEKSLEIDVEIKVSLFLVPC